MAAIASSQQTFSADTSAPSHAARPGHGHGLGALARDLGMGEDALDPAELGSTVDDLAQLLQQVTVAAHEFHPATGTGFGTPRAVS